MDSYRDKKPVLAVIGLGKLGAPMAACLAARGYTVVGCDLNPETVRLIGEGQAPVQEAQLQEMLLEARARLTATTDIEEAVRAADVTFVIVPTPSDEQGAFSLRFVVPVMERVARALRDKQSRHLVVLTSTVMPGATDAEVRPLLERISGKRCGVEFGLCYSPEFIALGTVVRDFLSPDFILIGESDPEAGEVLASIYREVCEPEPPVARMNYVNAEIAKLAVNTYVTTKITFANMLASLCAAVPGGDVDSVTGALGLDSRIGRKCLKGAVGYGGPCFPRDVVALSYLARSLGVPAALAETVDTLNRGMMPELVRKLAARLPAGARVGILGLSYKPGTPVIEESPGIALAQALHAAGFPVVAYDPLAMPSARNTLAGDVTFAESAEDCARQVDALVVTNPEAEYASLSPEVFRRDTGRVLLVDCWRILGTPPYTELTEYVAVGVGPVAGDRARE